MGLSKGLKKMTEKSATGAKKDKKALRLERLEAQMRENMKKRKAVSRARNTQETGSSDDGETGADD